MFRCYSYTIIRERINLCLLKLQLLKYSIKISRCVVNTMVVWLHILGPYWDLYVALFGSRLSLLTYALNRAATGTSSMSIQCANIKPNSLCFLVRHSTCVVNNIWKYI